MRPTDPKSSSPSLPSVSSRTLPGCGSAWKVPSSMTSRSRQSSRLRASAARTSAGVPASIVARGRPSRRSITSTCPVHSGWQGTGTAMPSLPRLPDAAATEVMLRASIRRLSSSRRAPANPAASPVAPTARPQLVLRSSRAASRPVISRSLSTVSLTSGRHTLTTTLAPEVRVAAWTWAMDAAAIGSRSKLANSSPTSAPSSDRSTCSIAGQGTGTASSCRRLSSLMNSAGRRSRRVDSTCPSLTKVTPPSSMASRTERATLARPCGVASSDRRPPRW